MTDKERLAEARRLNGCGFMLDPADFEWLCDLAMSAITSQPPAGSVKMQILVCRHGPDRDWYGTAEVFDSLTPTLEPETGATHAAIVEAWIPPITCPVVEGRVSNG